MQPLASYLEDRGYRVVNIGYPSTEHPVEWLTGYVAGKIEQYPQTQGARLHFVGHSLGGIVAHSYLKTSRPPNLGRVVMLGPPNGGSEIVDALGGTWLFRKIYGPAGRQLGTGTGSAPNRLGPVDFELGVIAGSRSLNPLFSLLIPGPRMARVAERLASVLHPDAEPTHGR